MVLPQLVGALDGGVDGTSYATGPLVVTSLGVRAGLRVLPGWTGLEVSATPAAFIVAPPDDVAWVARGAVTQRLIPMQPLAMDGETHDAFELAVRVRAGRDPSTLDFLGEAGVPMVFRASSAVRLDVTPMIGRLAVADRTILSATALVSFYPTRWLWLGPGAAVYEQNVALGTGWQISAGAEVGYTMPGPLGPLFDVVLDGRFPHLVLPAQPGQTTDLRTFEATLSVRLYAYWSSGGLHVASEP